MKYAIMQAGWELCMGLLVALVCLPADAAWADLKITASKADVVPKADNNPLVVQSLMADDGGITSLR